MKRTPALATAACAAVLLLAAASAVYVVGPTREVVLTRLGQPVGLVRPSSGAVFGGAVFGGLHLKWPLVEQAVEFDRRSRTVVADAVEGAGPGGRPLQASAYLRYSIDDPLRFYGALGDPQSADLHLQSDLEASLRSALSAASGGDAQEAVRRAALADARRRLAGEGQGLSIRDLELTSLTLPAAGLEAASRRMQSDAGVQAVQVRAEGEAKKRELMAQADHEAADLRADGERQALVIRGDGDAQRTAILGAAYSQDPDFARFFRRLEAYDQALNPDNSLLVLSADNAFLKLFAEGPDAKR